MPLYGTGQGFEAYANIQGQDARTRLTNIQANLGQMELQQKQQMMQLLSRRGLPPIDSGGQPTPASPDQLLEKTRDIANAAFATGNFKEGLEASRTAEQMARDKATQDAARSRKDYTDFQIQEKELQEIDGLLAGVHDQNSFNAAKMTYMAAHPGIQVPPQFAYYNPQMVEAIRFGTKQGLDKLRQEANTRAREAAVADKVDAAHSREFRDSLAAAREAREEAEAARKAKTSGAKAPAVGLPNAALMSYTQSLINKDYPGEQQATVSGFGKDELFTQHAFEIASQAKALMAQNRGLSASEAVARAYQDAKNSGMFEDYNPEKAKGGLIERLKGFLGEGSERATPGSVASMPLPLPPDGHYVKGSWYISNGKVAQYLGNGKGRVAAPEGAH